MVDRGLIQGKESNSFAAPNTNVISIKKCLRKMFKQILALENQRFTTPSLYKSTYIDQGLSLFSLIRLQKNTLRVIRLAHLWFDVTLTA